MKNLKTFIAILLTLHFGSLVSAQMTAFNMEDQKNCIHNAKYIFEGKVIRQECFYGGEDRSVLTCSIISITKIFKGSPEIKLGTIKFVTMQGGRVGKDTGKIVLNPITPSDLGPGVWKGGTYIIFGQDAPSNALHPMPSDNDVTLIMQCEPIEFETPKNAAMERALAFWRENKFVTSDELNNYLLNMGLNIQEPVSQADSTKY